MKKVKKVKKNVKSDKKMKKWQKVTPKTEKSDEKWPQKVTNFSDSGGQKVKILGSGFQNRGSKSVRFRVKNGPKKRSKMPISETHIS